MPDPNRTRRPNENPGRDGGDDRDKERWIEEDEDGRRMGGTDVDEEGIGPGRREGGQEDEGNKGRRNPPRKSR